MYDNYIGQLLISMPSLSDPFFKKTVILICEFSKKSVVGLILNKPIIEIKIDALLKNLKIKTNNKFEKNEIFVGGPVHSNQGFILHSDDKEYNETQKITNELRLTTSVNVLEDIASCNSPKLYKIFLGCSVWGYDQFNNEMLQNSWHLTNSNENAIFNDYLKDQLWENCIISSGIDKVKLAPFHGTA